MSNSIYQINLAESNGMPLPAMTPERPAADATPVAAFPVPQKTPSVWLELGSDVDIAKLIARQLKHDYSQVPYSEGQFWRYVGTHWEPIPRDELRRQVHQCDGLYWGPNARRVRLNKNRIDSIINEVGVILGESEFFEVRRLGINCLSGFISFHEGTPRLLPHDPDHRQRHVLQGRWEPGLSGALPENSLLARLLRGCFMGDPDAEEKTSLIAEAAGAAALGYGPKHTAPKAAVLLGQTAENGKSQILDLLRGLLPPTAVSSVPPTKFSDDKHLVQLVGKLLNTSDELGTARAIGSEGFKAIVTGEPVMARNVYVPAVEFRPQAQHVFACNQLPAFQGGMDRGVLRRLMPIVFNRTIPTEERVPHLGQRIVDEELDLVLAWAVEGATRLLKRGHFPELASSREALLEWARNADAVLGWIDDRLEIELGENAPRLKSNEAYADFRQWAIDEGHTQQRLPVQKTFTQRVKGALSSKGVEYGHSGDFRGFYGLRLTGRFD